jgi:5-formyltetrahydrofolate cyclo-ligase
VTSPATGPQRTATADQRAHKQALRREILARRRQFPAAVLARSAERVCAALLPVATGRRCAAYVPVGTEPGGDGLVEALAGAAGALLLPVLRADADLDWAAYAGRLAPAARGLSEPVGPLLGVDAIATAEVVVVPAVAVDRRGVRLGRGGGSYDRALTRVGDGAVVVALLHDGELVDRVPAAPHDRAVNAAVLPSDGWVALPRELGPAQTVAGNETPTPPRVPPP